MPTLDLPPACQSHSPAQRIQHQLSQLCRGKAFLDTPRGTSQLMGFGSLGHMLGFLHSYGPIYTVETLEINLPHCSLRKIPAVDKQDLMFTGDFAMGG